jgi:hypothetical protein
MAKYITVDITTKGEVKVEAHGFEGVGCKEATKLIEAALGDSTNVKYKAEWWALNGKHVLDAEKQFGIRTDKLCG